MAKRLNWAGKPILLLLYVFSSYFFTDNFPKKIHPKCGFWILNPPFPGYKLFEESVLDFDIPPSDRRKYKFLLSNVPQEGIEHPNVQNTCNYIFYSLNAKLMSTRKVPSYAYKVLGNQCSPQNRYDYWYDKLTVPQDTDWEKIHGNNFRCTIDTR